MAVLAAVSWLGIGLFGLPARVEAQSCGRITIEAGTVTPATGTTATIFQFSVTVSDRAGATPTWVRLGFNGTWSDMTPSGTTFRAGVVYHLNRTLPVGSWTYVFQARTGGTVCEDTQVGPSPVVVTVPPTPSPTPKATPKPPKATPKPTRATPGPGPKSTPKPGKATARPTARPSESQAPGATATSGSTPGSATASLVPSPDSTPSPTAAPSTPGVVAGPISGGAAGGSATAFDDGGLLAGATNPLTVWLVTTSGGLLLFLALVRRSRDDEAIHEGAAVATADVGIAGLASPMPATAVDEGRASLAAPVAPRTFPKPPARDVERARIGYHQVRISSKPDAVRSVERGRLDRGDEVEILDSYEGFLEIRTPDGITGWILRHTIVSS